MNIKKHGNIKKNECTTKDFRCNNCGCEFQANSNEYYEFRDNGGYSIGTISTYVYKVNMIKYICSCPECHHIVMIEEVDNNPTISGTSVTTDKRFLTETSSDCHNCSINPLNGGTGICNCIMSEIGTVSCNSKE